MRFTTHNVEVLYFVSQMLVGLRAGRYLSSLMSSGAPVIWKRVQLLREVIVAIVVIQILAVGAILGGWLMFSRLKKSPEPLTGTFCGALVSFFKFSVQVVVCCCFLLLMLIFITKMH